MLRPFTGLTLVELKRPGLYVSPLLKFLLSCALFYKVIVSEKCGNGKAEPWPLIDAKIAALGDGKDQILRDLEANMVHLSGWFLRGSKQWHCCLIVLV